MQLKEVSRLLTKVSSGQHLTVAETEEAFDVLTTKDTEGYFFTALAMGLLAKGITSDELLGFYRSEANLIPKINTGIKPSNITENSGTGGDKLKTFNVSTAAALILAGAGIYVPKQSYYAVTGIGGSGDLFREFGIDVVKTSNSTTIKQTLKKVGFVPYVANFLTQPSKMPGILNFLKKRGEIGLNFITPFHLVANILAPVKMERRIYGIFDNKYSMPLAQLMQKLGYKKGLIVYGVSGLDEVSNIGDTKITEFTTSKIKQYTVSPQDLGVKKALYKDIKAVSREQNTIDFLRVLYSKDKGAKRDPWFG